MTVIIVVVLLIIVFLLSNYNDKEDKHPKDDV